MLPLYDMLAQAQNGQGIDALARQFQLNQDQMQSAMAAVLPAFSEGLKRNAYDPYGMGSFMTALASGNHARYFDQPMTAFSQGGLNEGNGILGHLFGSKEVSRAVAQQAAHATGIGQEVFKQMLPALASMIMGGLYKQSTNQIGANAFGAGGNIIGEVIEQMMRQGTQVGGGMARQTQQVQPNPFDNPFGKVLEGMFGGGISQTQPRETTQSDPFADNPLGRIFEEMLGGKSREDPPARGQAKTNPSGRPRNPYDDLFGQMFESGREVRDEYQRGVESIFDQYMQGMKRGRR